MCIEALYHKASAGNKTARDRLLQILSVRFSFFVRRRVWNREDCEEIVQEALVAVHEKLGKLRTEVRFAAWAQGVLRNKLTDHIRIRSREQRTFTPAPDAGDWLPVEDTPPGLRRNLMDCLKKINSVNRQHGRVLVLRYQGFKFEEICNRLGISRSNAYTMLSRARSMLLTCLEKGDVR
jgi:RNA polymerase sigma-70 factor (ECF subfamily)